jgi:transposase
VLEDAGIEMSTVMSRTRTGPGRLMSEALVAGDRDPHAVADLAPGNARPEITELGEALAGRFDDKPAVLAGQAPDHLDYRDARIAALTQRIENPTQPRARRRDLLVGIPGVCDRIAEVILAGTGGDMTQVRTAAGLAGWAGVAPANNVSAAKNRSGSTTHGNRRLPGDAAAAAARTRNTCLHSCYQRMVQRRGARRALVAVLHKTLTAVWRVLSHDTP